MKSCDGYGGHYESKSNTNNHFNWLDLGLI